jgi:predicted amino acid dehydrogenase
MILSYSQGRCVMTHMSRLGVDLPSYRFGVAGAAGAAGWAGG